VAAGSTLHQRREAASEGPGKAGKNPQTRETTYQGGQEPAKAREDPREEPIRRALHGAAPARARRGRRRLKSGDDEQEKGRGPAPEVSCSPPAEYPRPPFASQRETYRLELRGSCGRVQAALSDLFIYLFIFSGQGTGSATQRVPQTSTMGTRRLSRALPPSRWWNLV